MGPEQALRRCVRAWRLTEVGFPVDGATKNLTRRCRLRGGAQVLVKCAPNPFDRGIEREAQALRWLTSVGSVRAPKVVHFEARTQVLALEYFPDAPTAHDALERRALSVRSLRQAGGGLASLHLQSSAAARPPWAAPPDESLLDCFVWTRPAFATRLSIDGMRLIGTVQADRAAVQGLVALSQAARTCVIHGDAKLPNLLVPRRGDPVWLDWELSQWGDPAQDLGSLLADLMRHALPAAGAARRLSPRGLALASQAVFDGYEHVAPVDRAFTSRVRKWIGAHLLFYAHTLVLTSGVLDPLAAQLLRRARALLGGRR